LDKQILAGKSTLDVSPITDYLYISAWPRGDHAEEIHGLNVRLILSMHWTKPSKSLGQPPVQLLWLPTIDNPLVPMPISTLQRGVDAALPVIREGYRVLVHCRYGVHRSVAMACCVLIGMGSTADEAMKLVEQKRSVADPRAGHIQRRIYIFEQQWQGKTY
jgi:protein-tyrosine phosphatase